MKLICTLLTLVFLTSCGSDSQSPVSSLSSTGAISTDLTIPSGKTRVAYHMEANELKVFSNDGEGNYSEIDSESLTGLVSFQYNGDFLFTVQDSGTGSAQIKAHTVGVDGSLTFVASLGTFSGSTVVSFAPNSEKFYATNATGMIFQRSFNKSTYAVSTDFNKNYGTNIDSLNANNEGVWAMSGSNLIWSHNTSSNFDSEAVGAGSTLISNTVVASDTFGYRANGTDLDKYEHIDVSLVGDIDTTPDSASILDNYTSIIFKDSNIYTSTDNDEIKIYDADLSNEKTYPICTGGKISNIQDNIISVNCNTELRVYSFTGTNLDELEGVDSGANIINSYIVHL